jgi:hypothetical protein
VRSPMQKSLLLLFAAACGAAPAPAPAPAPTPAPTPTPAPVPVVVEPKPVAPKRAAAPLVRAPGRAPSCGKLAAKLEAEAPLLADRLRIRVPKAAGELARAYDVMSSPKSIAEETRLMLGGGKSAGKAPGDEAFVVLARELWQLDPDVVKAEADAIVQPSPLAEEAPKFLRALYGDGRDLDIEEVTVGDGSIRAFAGRPKQVAVVGGGDSALALVLLLALPDATLQTVDFWITPGLAGDAGCVDLAERAGASLAVGARKLERTAATRDLGRARGKTLALAFPADYTAIHQPGPDFDIYKVYYLRPLGLFPGSMNIAVDAHPSRQAPDGATDEKGRLLGKQVVWKARRSPRGGVMIATTDPIAKSPDTFVQVSIVATRQEKFLDEFKRVAETLAIR